MRRVILALALFALVGVINSNKAHATLYTYSYTGNNFTDLRGVYTTAHFISGQFTVDLPTNLNVAVADYTSNVTAFSFSDGVQIFTDADGPFDIIGFLFTTDATGMIDFWDIVLAIEPPDEFFGLRTNREVDVAVFSDELVNVAFAVTEPGTDPGTWRLVAVSEPSTLALTTLALAALVFLGWSRRVVQLQERFRIWAPQPRFLGPPCAQPTRRLTSVTSKA